jgi:hypothetical protein
MPNDLELSQKIESLRETVRRQALAGVDTGPARGQIEDAQRALSAARRAARHVQDEHELALDERVDAAAREIASSAIDAIADTLAALKIPQRPQAA